MDAIKVTTNRDGCDRCHHREASKLLQNKPLEREEEGQGNQLRSHKRPCQQARQDVVRALWVSQQNSSHDDNYCHRCINRRKTSATNTAMKPGDPLNGKHQADRANSCPWSHTTQALGSTKKAKTSSKNKRSCHDTWNARHGRDTLSINSVGESTGSARDTVPNKTKQVRGTTTANTILVDSTQKNKCGLWCCLTLALPQDQSHKMFGEKFVRQSWLGWWV